MNALKNECKKIGEIVKSCETFFVAAHYGPEGDAIGSTLAVTNYLLSLGKNVLAYNQDGVPQNFKFLPNSDLIQTEVSDENNFDASFIVDCSEFSRVGPEIPSKERLGRIVNIDHHRTSMGVGEVNYIDPGASSAGELIYNVLKTNGARIDLKIAEPLYTAIHTDTGSFRYSNSTPSAFEAASELIKVGVEPWKIAQAAYENMPAAKLKMTAEVLNTLEIFEKEKFASVTLLKETIERTEALPEYSDGLVNFPRSIDGIEVAMIFKEVSNDSYKIGMRSKGKVDVSKIALSFGGGGHKNAAGCQVKGTLKEVKEKIYEKARKAVGEIYGDSSGK